MIKYKVMYDLEAHFSFKSSKLPGWVGLIFRKVDMFNYYALDVSNKYIRFRKMINGK